MQIKMIINVQIVTLMQNKVVQCLTKLRLANQYTTFMPGYSTDQKFDQFSPSHLPIFFQCYIS